MTTSLKHLNKILFSTRKEKRGVGCGTVGKSLSSMHKTLGSVPHTPKLGVMVLPVILALWEVEAGESEV